MAVEAMGGMFGFVFSADGPIRRFAQVAEADTDRFRRFFHGMLPGQPGHLMLLGGANMSQGKFGEVDLVRLSTLGTQARPGFTVAD